jgi:hypothetical protein
MLNVNYRREPAVIFGRNVRRESIEHEHEASVLPTTPRRRAVRVMAERSGRPLIDKVRLQLVATPKDHSALVLRIERPG